MSNSVRGPLCFAVIACLLMIVGFGQSWSVALSIVNLCLISAIMALGLNMQWGYAGLFNVGVMGFAALGGMSAVLISSEPVAEAWKAGGLNLLWTAVALVIAIAALVFVQKKVPRGALRMIATAAVLLIGYGVIRIFFDPATDAIEEVDPAKTGFLGGLDLPIMLAWPIGGVVAAAAAWLIAKVALGLRSDYLAIATLGISEIVLAVLKNEDWLTRGVKNVVGLDRPVPYEVDLQSSAQFESFVAGLGMETLDASTIFVKLCYAALFIAVLAVVMVLAQKALNSPWGRMMRAIRDNEVAAEAMGKDVTRRHTEIFVIGAAVIGIAGAMLTTLDGQFTPSSYQPLRFTFLIWVIVIVGGSGNNWGSILGAFVIWFVWIEAEPAGLWLMETATSVLGEDSALREHLLMGAPYTRVCVMGLILLIVLRFSPRGLIPEPVKR